jgi:hypothetical protein
MFGVVKKLFYTILEDSYIISVGGVVLVDVFDGVDDVKMRHDGDSGNVAQHFWRLQGPARGWMTALGFPLWSNAKMSP